MRYFLFCFLLVLTVVSAAWDFSYNLNMVQVKETTTLGNSFSVSDAISPTVSLNGNGSFTATRSDLNEKFNDFRSVSGGLSWRPMNGVEMATTLLKSMSLEDSYGERVRDNQVESASGTIRYSRNNWLTSNVAVGIEDRDYVNATSQGNNDGGFYRVNATVNRTVFNKINTSISFLENRSYGNETNNFGDGISARMSYYFPEEFRGGSISADIAGDNNSIIQLDSLENKLGESWSHSESVELPEIISGVFIDFGTRWSGSNTHYESGDPDSVQVTPRDNDKTGSALSSNLLWELAENIELDFAFTRSLSDNERIAEIYGTEKSYKIGESWDDRLLNITLSYTPGRARVSFQRLVELFSYDTEIDEGDTTSVYTDDYDRDEYRDLLGITASIPLSSLFSVNCTMTGQQRSSYYLMASQSANSKTTSSYAFGPGYRYQLNNDWNIVQDLKITANYTTYIFEEASASDRLSRRLVETFTLSRISSDSTALGIGHRFTFTDQGTFDDNYFLRSEESLNNRITIDAGFHVSSSVGLTPSYTYEYAMRNRMDLHLKTIDHIHHVGIRSAIKVMGGTLNTNITRSFYSNSNRDSYWIARVGYNMRM